LQNRLLTAVTADTAIRLARALGTSEQFWMGLQADYDLEEARKAAQGSLKKVVGDSGDAVNLIT